ncbi:hypothetical protein MIR68_005524 [Amoeboaphelidium protococcarum]|nr:hypothetical protein MIR68_005524 [Amoeboaphelidium protococcarum]
MKYEFKIDNDEVVRVQISSLSGIKNPLQLKKDVMSGKVSAALIKRQMIYNDTILKLAIFNALESRHRNNLKANTVYGEIIYNISPAMHVSEAFKYFGFDEKDDDLLVVEILPIDGTSSEWTTQYANSVSDSVKFSPDVYRLRQLFRIPSNTDNEKLDRFIISSLATKHT